MAGKYYGEYTQRVDNTLAAWAQEDDENYEGILTFINEKIRPFPERLLCFYNKETGQDLSATDAKSDLLKRAKEQGISLNRNTMNAWFTDTTPKMDDSARTNLFRIAFILGLDIEETKTLFNDVFLDRAYNLRNRDEFIYFYCLCNDRPYSTAETLIATIAARLGESITPQDQTILTAQIEESAWGADEDSIVKYIQDHQYNFSLKNVTATRIFQEKWEEITGTKEKKGLAQRESEFQEYIEYDEKGKPISIFTNQCKYSNEFALKMILGQFSPTRLKGKKELNEYYRNEISNQFPDELSIKNTNSAFVLRKNLILAYFYWYWIKAKLERNAYVSFEGFRDELDGVLEESGLSMLYPGNPYDALFLYSAYAYKAVKDSYTVLNVFRGLINKNRND